MNKFQITNLLYKEKNYSKIKELLNNSNDSWSFSILAKISLEQGNIKEAFEYYNKANNITGCAYCNFLKGDIAECKILLSLINNYSPFVNWLISLINITEGNFSRHPQYFEIRNFYEQDLENLFRFNQTNMIEKIINSNAFLEKYNREIYKYTGRVLFNNGYYDIAEEYIRKSLDISYKDPETHFLLGEIYEKKGQNEEAKTQYEKAIEVNGFYLPASNKLMIV